MLSAAEKGLAANMQAIKDYEPMVAKSWDMDPDSKEDKKFSKRRFFSATIRPYFYTAYKALREVIQRAEAFGLSNSLAKDRIEPRSMRS